MSRPTPWRRPVWWWLLGGPVWAVLAVLGLLALELWCW